MSEVCRKTRIKHRKRLAVFMTDFYKQFHAEQYNENMGLLVSYYTPRKSRIRGIDQVISFNIQAFIMKFLIEAFDDDFFNLDEKYVVEEYLRVIKGSVTANYAEVQKIIDLHRLGYLPIEISIIPEGTIVPMHVPMIQIKNTLPEFVWVVNLIESIMSCEDWYPMTIANQAYFGYRKVVDMHYDLSVDDNIPHSSAVSEFGYRGGEGHESATLASAAFLTSFDKTATIEALYYMEDYYGGDIAKGTIGKGMISTEHSVMCSNTAIDGSESAFIKKLLTKLYPSENLSMVCDSYDYWNTVTNIIGKELKQDVLNRDGTLFVRGDSGDPVDIVCGETRWREFDSIEEMTKHAYNGNHVSLVKGQFYEVIAGWDPDFGEVVTDYYKIELTPAQKGTVYCLWESFGGRINSKGYKVLCDKVRALYGDSITPLIMNAIYTRLEEKGFAANNVALGAGSFSMQCMEVPKEIYDKEGNLVADKILSPFTRDTYSIAVKTTYGELKDGTPVMIFKDPKTDTGKFKKSQKGMCCVHRDEQGNITYTDGYTSKNLPTEAEGNMFRVIFRDSEMVYTETLDDIRNRLHNGKF